ncbi:hypothetical protein SOVF_171360 [Spinacia oleracea]|nr:hypothetical protein SOVF_171360 [Spinacia oleracea]
MSCQTQQNQALSSAATIEYIYEPTSVTAKLRVKCYLKNANVYSIRCLGDRYNRPLYPRGVYVRIKRKGFKILAFPLNQFGGQEPGSNLK